tara:strand:- start:166 stop:456 length:291 start_codon:yes stop_codon:yes gene_type:complete
MIKVKAKIKLYSGKDGGRKTPFKSGYRPLFQFPGCMKTSGQISLINIEEFLPEAEGCVEILFISKEHLGKNFSVGSKFTFGEGFGPIGEGEVLKIF